MSKQIPDRIVFLLITVFCVLLYGNTLSYGITWLDDYHLLVKAAPILSDFRNIFNIFLSGVLLDTDSSMYRPLLNVSFMADTMLNGGGFFFSHLINIVLHIVASCLVYALLREFKVGKGMSAALSLLFAAHPASSVAVAWIPGRNDSLLACLVFPALLFAERYRHSGNHSHCIAYGVFTLLSLLTKESSIVLPFLVAMWLFLNRKHSKADLWHFSLASLFPLLIWHVLRSFSTVQTSMPQMIPTLKNLAYMPVLAGRAIFPVSPVVSSSYSHLGFPWLFAFLAICFFAISFFLLKKENKNSGYEISSFNICLFGLCWFFAFILPTMAAGKGISFGNSYFEHRLYVPLAGILLIVSRLIPLAGCRFCRVYALSALILFFSCVSFCHSSYYESREILWPRIAHESPSDFDLWIWSGFFEKDRMLYGAAEFYYRKSLEADPNQVMAHFLIAEAAYHNGNIVLAKRELDEELRRFPENRDALLLQAEIGKYE